MAADQQKAGWVIKHIENSRLFYDGCSITGFASLEDATIYDTEAQAECWRSARSMPTDWRVVPYAEALQNAS